MIVHAIDDAKSELLVQAYGFTSGPIIPAVARAKERGVNVRVILDKINEQKRYTAATYLKNHGPETDFLRQRAETRLGSTVFSRYKL